MTSPALRPTVTEFPARHRGGQHRPSHPVAVAGRALAGVSIPRPGHPDVASCNSPSTTASVKAMTPAEQERTMPGGAPYLTIEEICERFRVPIRTVRYWRVKGTGPQAIRVGRHLRYPLDEVERYEAEQREEESRRQQGLR